MFAAIRAYEGLECTYWTLTGLREDDKLQARKQKKQARVIASFQEQLADMTLQRDQAVVRDEDATQRVRTLTHANNNADRIIEQLV
jgi:hypothetical protein